MPKIQNVSPLGALDVPLLGRDVAAGEVVEVTADQAARLLGQEGVWEAVEDAPAPKFKKTGSAAHEAVPTTGEGE